MKIAIIDLDTSHPRNWIPILRDLGCEIVGVLDHGDVHPMGYAQTFARAHAIPHVFRSLSEAVDASDIAVLHGCDWDQHLARATPFVEAGRSVLIDKPVAGCADDLDTFERWARTGARITGGSSLRFCNEAHDYLARPIDDRGTPHTVLCGCGTDEFNYGIHAYSLLAALIGGEMHGTDVRHMGRSAQRRIEVRTADGRIGWLIVGAATVYQPFHATVISDKSCIQFQPDSTRLYRALLVSVLPFLSGETDKPPLPIDQWLTPERWAVAALQSWSGHDRWVSTDQLDRSTRYSGRHFACKYRTLRYPE